MRDEMEKMKMTVYDVIEHDWVAVQWDRGSNGYRVAKPLDIIVEVTLGGQKFLECFQHIEDGGFPCNEVDLQPDSQQGSYTPGQLQKLFNFGQKAYDEYPYDKDEAVLKFEQMKKLGATVCYGEEK